VTVNSALKRETQTAQPAAVTVASPTPCAATAPIRVEEAQTADVPEWCDSPKLEAWKNRHNGTQLPLDYGNPSVMDVNIEEAKTVFLSSGGSLVAFADTMYMLDEERRVVWKYNERRIFDFVYVEATGLVYVVASGNTMLILDAATGKRLAHYSGETAYVATLPYGADQCLVAEVFAGDREDFTVTPAKDSVSAWRGTKMLWRVKIPPDAKLQVSGSRIFAVTKTETKIMIEVPKGER
jgi:hypothetical protein